MAKGEPKDRHRKDKGETKHGNPRKPKGRHRTKKRKGKGNRRTDTETIKGTPSKHLQQQTENIKR